MPPRPSSFLQSLCLFILFLLPATSLAQQPAVQPRITQAVDEASTTVLRGNVHPLARVQLDSGVAPASLPMQRMLLVLKRSDQQEAALRQLLDEQQDKSAPNYHKWLTPDDFGRRFGPADQDIQTVTSWLQSHGFEVSQVSKGAYCH
jgi:subtilase family serine protease